MENMLSHVFFCFVGGDLLVSGTAEQLFGVELRSEADCEYPLDMRRLGKKEACT